MELGITYLLKNMYMTFYIWTKILLPKYVYYLLGGKKNPTQKTGILRNYYVLVIV